MAKNPLRRRVFDLRGESFNNPDGSHRQAIIADLMTGQPVRLEIEPPESDYPGAVRVTAEWRGAQRGVGSIAREDQDDVRAIIEAVPGIEAHIHEIKGGFGDYASLGLKICLSKPGQKRLKTPVQQREDYARRRREGAGEGGGGCVVIFAAAGLSTIVAVMMAGGLE